MRAAVTVPELLSLLRSAGLWSEQEQGLAQSLARIESASPPEEVLQRWMTAGLLTRWQRDELSQGRADFSFGEFVLVEHVGKGSMGTVFKALEPRRRRTIALKILSSSVANAPQAKERFLREAQATTSVRHPNVITAFDVGEYAGKLYMALEFVEGQTLDRALEERGAMPVPLACEYARQVAIGLGAIHEARLLHRDLKLSNVMVSAGADLQPLVRILDLGLAKAVGHAHSLTKTGQLIGTPDYMAPEQARDARRVDERTDLYSLGLILFELLSGKKPFDAPHPMTRLLARLEGPAPSIRTLRPEVPTGLESLIARLLERDKEQRCKSALETARLLAPFAGPEPTTRRDASRLFPPLAARRA